MFRYTMDCSALWKMFVRERAQRVGERAGQVQSRHSVRVHGVEVIHLFGLQAQHQVLHFGHVAGRRRRVKVFRELQRVVGPVATRAFVSRRVHVGGWVGGRMDLWVGFGVALFRD